MNAVLVEANAARPTRVAGAEAAVELIDAVERARRLVAVAAVDAIDAIDSTRAYYGHGHASAKTMWAHVAQVSGAEAHRLEQIRRMIGDCAEIAGVWREAGLSVDKAALLARAFANPRTRDRFSLDQRWFLNKARRFDYPRLQKIVARWLEVHDTNGPDPGPDPGFERRNLSLTQDHFSKTWTLNATLGSLQGSELNEILGAYAEAEFGLDWAQAQHIHGDDTCGDHLARTSRQRMVDALCQIAADAVNSTKRSVPVKRVHNIVWNAETYEELLRRWVDGPARWLDPDLYTITDLDGHPMSVGEAFADSLVSSLRRVVKTAAGVIIDLSTETRFFTGLARLGIELATDECYWPGCHIPTTRCQMDHLRPAARGGPTDQINGLPACARHNRFKERGYKVARQPNGTITITTPTGQTIQ